MPSVLIDQPKDGEKLKPPSYKVTGSKLPKHADVTLTITATKGHQFTTTFVPKVNQPAAGKWDHTIQITTGYKYVVAAYNGAAAGTVTFES